MTLIFENHGVLDSRLIGVIGANVKEGTSPIGIFGTGLKYAIAAGLRLGIGIEIHTDGKIHSFGVQPDEIRGKRFEFVGMVTRHGPHSDIPVTHTPFGFTTEFGKLWEPWMIYRELYSNALDEGGRVYEPEGVIEPDAGLTRIIVTGLDEIHARRSEWFLDVSESKLLSDTPSCQVFDGASTGVFYHGIRVLDLERPSTFTYNILGHLELTEDRTAKYRFSIDAKIRDAITRMCDKSLIDRIIHAPPQSIEGRLDYDDAIFTANHVSDEFVSAVAEASRSEAPFNKTALHLAHKKARENFLPKPRAPSDSERAALKGAFLTLARIGVHVSPVVVVDGVSGEGFASSDKIWLTPKSFGDHLAARLLEFQLDLDATDRREQWLIERLVNISDKLGAAMAGSVVMIPDLQDVEIL